MSAIERAGRVGRPHDDARAGVMVRPGPIACRRLGIAVLVVVSAAAFLTSPATGAPGGLDSTFGSGGKVTTDIGSTSRDAARDLAVQPDGKIVVVGSSASDFAVVRYNTDGSADATFGSGGKVATDIGSASVDSAEAVALQGDGKIVVAGRSADDFAVVRYRTDGSLDPTFDLDGKVTTDVAGTFDAALGVAIQPDGKIVAAGGAWNLLTEESDFTLVRYHPDGSLDNAFDSAAR